MKKIAYCLLLFITHGSVYLSAQAYQPAVPKDKSAFIDSEGKQPSSTAVRVIPRVRENYESTFSRSTVDTDRAACGTMPFFEQRHEAQRACAFYGEADIILAPLWSGEGAVKYKKLAPGRNQQG